MEHGYAIGGYEEEVERYNSSSDNGDDFDDPPMLSPPHTMDIPSVRGPPVTVPAERVYTHDLPLASPLALVERELFHNSIIFCENACGTLITNRQKFVALSSLLEGLK